MGRLAERFRGLREAGRRALIPYLTAGDPDPELTVPLMEAMVAAGADVLELGVPFSDPMADGPVIQRASERALAQGVTLHQVLELVRRFRAGDAHTPVVLMGYLNPVEAMGYEDFAREAAAAGADGVLTVDMPPEEAEGLVTALRRYGLDPIFLLAPTTGEARLAEICRLASAYVYYVSLKGVTGAGSLDTADVARHLEAIRRHTDLPVGVGFGIKDAAAAARVAQVADAVVVGSALIQRIEEHLGREDEMREAVTSLLAEMRRAMDAGAAP